MADVAGTRDRRHKLVRWTVVAVVIATATGVAVTRGLSPWEVEARVAEVVRSHPESTRRELVRAIADEFTDGGATFRGSDGAAFSPVGDSGIVGEPVVDRFDDGTVRVAVAYAEAPVIPTGWGDMYCLVIDVPIDGGTHRAMAPADFTRADHCAGALADVPRE